MTADVEEDDLLFRNENREGNAVAMGNAYCLHSFQLAGQAMELQVRLERITLKVAQDEGELLTQVAVVLHKFFGGAGKGGRPDKGIHDLASSFSSSIRSSAVPRLTRPSFRS